MIEKLLENWLDRASERSYQAVFVQMLAAEGYTVLHSTRHCLLEYGKDILAIAPDGVGCAFQLKGDPGGRMKISEFRKDIQPQLTQLMAQSPSYPGFPTGAHRAYLVSNGQFEEEVQVAVREMNNGPYPSKTLLWSRGHLLDMCKIHASALWPSELKDNRALLELYMADPREPLDVDILSGMMESILKLSADNDCLKQTELARAASSTAWLTGIVTAIHAENENHHAVISAWTLCCVSLIAASEKHGDASVSAVGESLKLAKNALIDALAALWSDVTKKDHLVEGDAFTDPEIFGWRVGVLFGLLSCLSIADEEIPILDAASRNALRSWLKQPPRQPELWGEAVVAHLIPWVTWLRINDPTRRPDAEISELATAVIVANQPNSTIALANPYYDFDAVLRHRLGMPLSAKRRSLAREAIAGNSYTAEALLHLLVRANMKGKCKSLWARFTKLSHHRLVLDKSWHYCLVQAPTGSNETKIYPSSYQWSQLKCEALNGICRGEVPSVLQRSPWLLALWWQVAPHRMNSEAVRVFVDEILPGWGT
ncbi:hypothetical protein [Duganella callida]|uniref:Uncharacterized protein n=1 Tax=Duganella callida TaxID=2561932 RepID=A0A4Y9SMC2_9BURK|nr:hypothetical protein [Duganella callida]TFW27815.1 hypothetical protein E4L98_06350 [Duganella callida]